jgi:hypothetical protein
MTTRGVVYIAYGRRAVVEATASIFTLLRFHDWPVAVIGERIPGCARIEWPNPGTPGRWAKVNLARLTPFDETLFLDADTRIHGTLDSGFHLLQHYDLVLVPSRPQHSDVLSHLCAEERAFTLQKLLDPLQLNTGVMWFNRAVAPLFEAWRAEWQMWQDKDQGALLRALEIYPTPYALLGAPFNDRSGTVVEHRFGAAA